ncbi:peptidase S1 [Tsukamurella asaccharolytica]|uniref:Peptidase S1 n=1 Tax=Tsukamurella asaccharolytica TaxID=2592067 RepID=A0A5C5RAM4_9ACTN|nr:peptidase S1 [Tsukamurella asaccharolytica]TWS19141.1 peptidase S1 [Tsukamurella asaccharolytica]
MRLSLSRRLGVAATVALATAGVVSAAPASAAPRIVVGPGSEIDVVQNETAQGIEVSACTVGVLATTPDGRRVGVTAGHCGKAGQEVTVPAPGQARALISVGKIEKSSNPPTAMVDGHEVSTNVAHPDWGTVSFKEGVPLVNRLGKAAPRSLGKARIGDKVCSQGRTSGWVCGSVTDVTDNRFRTDLKLRSGDSGASLIRLSDGAALGIHATGSVEPGRDGSEVSDYWDLGFILAQAGGLRLAV